MSGYGMSAEMFSDFKKVDYYKFKVGEHKFRILPAYKPNRLFSKVDVHWGFTDANNQRYPVKCFGKDEGCPICALHANLIAQKDSILAQGKLEEAKNVEKRASEVRRSPTYLWQIKDYQDAHKVLSLSFRPHEALIQKIGFAYKNEKIDVTNPEKSYMIYCNKSGRGSQMNYHYEIMKDSLRKIECPELLDLDDVYDEFSLEQLQEIVNTGSLPTNKKKESPETQATNNTNDNKEAAASTSTPSNTVDMNQGQQDQVNNVMGAFTSDDIPF